MNIRLLFWCAILSVYFTVGCAFASDACADCHGAKCDAAPVVALTYPAPQAVAAAASAPVPWWARWVPPPRRRPVPPPRPAVPPPKPRPAVPPPRW